MTQLRVLLQRLRGLLRKGSLEQDLDEELRSHLQMEIDEHVRKGMDPAAARSLALRRFGGVARTKEIYRETHGLPAFEIVLQDLRYGFRMLGRSPGFTAVAILSLALGIGANTAIFTLIHALILKSLPVANPQELVQIRAAAQRGFPGFVDLRVIRVLPHSLGTIFGSIRAKQHPVQCRVRGTTHARRGRLCVRRVFFDLGSSALARTLHHQQ